METLAIRNFENLPRGDPVLEKIKKKFIVRIPKKIILFLWIFGNPYSSKKLCPDLNRNKWSRGAINALMNQITNQHKISLKRCLPEVTDFSCARLSR